MSELTKEMPKKLGFGCMRLPVTDGSTENINDAAFCEMIDSYIEHELQKSLQTMGANKIQLNQIITALRKKQDLEGELSQDKKEMLQKTMKNMLIIDKELAEQKKEFEDLQSVVSEDSNARIKVYGTAYAGTKLVFGDQFMFIKEKYDHCQFIKERADIKSALL